MKYLGSREEKDTLVTQSKATANTSSVADRESLMWDLNDDPWDDTRSMIYVSDPSTKSQAVSTSI